MPSVSYGRWTTTRKSELNEIERAHTAIGGTGRGRRYATQQINQAYAVLVASQFQGYCRDLHSESVDYLVPNVRPMSFQASTRELLTQGLQLKRGNAQPASIGADFGRFGVDFWTGVKRFSPDGREPTLLLGLKEWRNAIAHQDLAGKGTLRLRHVQQWRKACGRLARCWCRAAAQSGEQLDIALECLRIDADFQPSDQEALRTAFGLEGGGATLIRPDGYVAWRSIELPADPVGVLNDALARVSSAVSQTRAGKDADGLAISTPWARATR
jgi:hypothetical protein